jgi:hypothetical protein
MTDDLRNKTQSLLRWLSEIKKIARMEVDDARRSGLQISTIDALLTKYTNTELDLNDVYNLLREDIGGSFELPHNSILRKQMEIYWVLHSGVRVLLNEYLLNTYMLSQEYSSQPLPKFIERHGGPLFYELVQIRIKFQTDYRVHLTYDSSLSQMMSPNLTPIRTEQGRFEIMSVLPFLINGQITLDREKSFLFSTVSRDLDYLILENPPFWKESVVIKRSNKSIVH